MSYESFLEKIPAVSSPAQRLTLAKRLKWTAVILLLYFLMSDITAYGVDTHAVGSLASLSILLGASFGSLITLGIGPIVTASIILQLLVGAGIINWDLHSHHGRVKFQGTQKLLAVAFAFIEGAAYTFFGAVTPVSFDSGTLTLIMLQLALGAILVIFLDEVISKWGFGSGVSLFIAAGVSKEIFIRMFSLIKTDTGSFIGLIPGLIQRTTVGDIAAREALAVYLLPIVATLAVFALVVYAQSMRVEIPLAFGNVRGFGRKWPLKFIYASNMPVILMSALLINLRVWGSLLSKSGINIFGTFDSSGNPISGLLYFLTPPTTLFISFTWIDLLRAFTYMLLLVGGSALFSVFWVNTANMDSSSVAAQIRRVNMQIPGFRNDPRIVERVLERYIPALTILGGAFVGFLAAVADMTGALGTGTGILLTVMILFGMYEQLAQQQMEDMHPAMRKLFGKGE